MDHVSPIATEVEEPEREADRLPLFIAEVKNLYSYTDPTPRAFVSCIGTNIRLKVVKLFIYASITSVGAVNIRRDVNWKWYWPLYLHCVH
jgi:hypothetical protein